MLRRVNINMAGCADAVTTALGLNTVDTGLHQRLHERLTVGCVELMFGTVMLTN